MHIHIVPKKRFSTRYNGTDSMGHEMHDELAKIKRSIGTPLLDKVVEKFDYQSDEAVKAFPVN